MGATEGRVEKVGDSKVREDSRFSQVCILLTCLFKCSPRAKHLPHSGTLHVYRLAAAFSTVGCEELVPGEDKEVGDKDKEGWEGRYPVEGGRGLVIRRRKRAEQGKQRTTLPQTSHNRHPPPPALDRDGHGEGGGGAGACASSACADGGGGRGL
jgi:hypothetical protein